MLDAPIDLAGERLLLLPERAVYWPRRETLLIADTHWGKAATLRAASIPVPGGTTAENLSRLDSVLLRTGARRLVVLGDCIHARASYAPSTVAALTAWRGVHPALEMTLVRGNHDRRAGDPPASLAIRCLDAPAREEPFVYSHYPKASPDGYTLAGHIHPAIRVHGKAAERATMPCFWFTEHAAILPAFGPLTGTAKIKPAPGDRVFAIAGDEVIELRT